MLTCNEHDGDTGTTSIDWERGTLDANGHLTIYTNKSIPAGGELECRVNILIYVDVGRGNTTEPIDDTAALKYDMTCVQVD